MKHDYTLFLTSLLRRDMEQKGLAPNEALKPDGERHEYTTQCKGKLRRATYVASLDNFGGDDLILVCSYGFVDSNQQHTFSKSLQEIVNS